MNLKYFLRILATITIFVYACKNDPLNHDNPFDPASDNYQIPILPVQKILYVNDFEFESDALNYWGKEHKTVSKNGASLISSIVYDDSLQSNVLKMDFDISDSADCTIKWFQIYASTDSTAFDYKVMDIKNITFNILGGNGNEIIRVYLQDVYGHTSLQEKEIHISKSWKTERIPLTFFNDGIINLRRLGNITIQSTRNFGGTTISQIYLDDLAFDWVN